MKTKLRKILATAFSTSVIALVANTAHAGGVLGDLINNVVPGLGTVLDQQNAAAGHPFEGAVAAAADSYIPGAGAVLGAGWAAQYGQGQSAARPQQQNGQGQQYPATQPYQPYQPSPGYRSPQADRGYGSSYSAQAYGRPAPRQSYGPRYSRDGYAPQYSARGDTPYGSNSTGWRNPYRYPSGRYGYSR